MSAPHGRTCPQPANTPASPLLLGTQARAFYGFQIAIENIHSGEGRPRPRRHV
jgi:hypothetical protein